MSESLQPAWVIHRRPYGDGGFIVELFTVEQGRIGAVLRGARRRSRGGSGVGLAQPFTPLLVGTSGRGELKTLRRIESVSATIGLDGLSLFSGLYVNELITRLLPRYDPHPALFALYGEVLAQLREPEAELSLRRFELALLEEVGYGLVFESDAQGDALEQGKAYRFDPRQGFIERHFDQHPEAANRQRFSGDALLAIAHWRSQMGPLAAPEPAAPELAAPEKAVLKAVNRLALSELLGERPLQSRELLRQFLHKGSTVPANEVLTANPGDSA